MESMRRRITYMFCFETAGVSGDGSGREPERNLQGYLWVIYLLSALLVKCCSHDRVPAGPREARARH